MAVRYGDAPANVITIRRRDERMYAIGIDLGKEVDHSAMALVERVTQEGEDEFHVVGLKRWELRTEYRQIVKDTQAVLGREPALKDAPMVIDETGVGKPVVKLFMEAFQRGELGRNAPRGIIIHGGIDKAPHRVPKLELVSTMLVLMQGGRLKFAGDLPLGDVVVKELRAFTAKISPTGQTQYESARERDHDDLVLSVAMACWAGRRTRQRHGAGF